MPSSSILPTPELVGSDQQPVLANDGLSGCNDRIECRSGMFVEKTRRILPHRIQVIHHGVPERPFRLVTDATVTQHQIEFGEQTSRPLGIPAMLQLLHRLKTKFTERHAPGSFCAAASNLLRSRGVRALDVDAPTLAPNLQAKPILQHRQKRLSPFRVCLKRSTHRKLAELFIIDD